jgi:hypothetical protein
MVWFSTGLSARVFLGAMMASFPIIAATVTGVQSVDRDFDYLHFKPQLVFLSDRIVFLSEKPTRITKIVEIDLPRPRAADAASRVALLSLAEELVATL